MGGCICVCILLPSVLTIAKCTCLIHSKIQNKTEIVEYQYALCWIQDRVCTYEECQLQGMYNLSFMLLLLRPKSKVTIYFSVKDSLKFLYNFVLWNVFDLKKNRKWVSTAANPWRKAHQMILGQQFIKDLTPWTFDICLLLRSPLAHKYVVYRPSYFPYH